MGKLVPMKDTGAVRLLSFSSSKIEARTTITGFNLIFTTIQHLGHFHIELEEKLYQNFRIESYCIKITCIITVTFFLLSFGY